MKLLVSVRSAEEALAALAGGADVIDAKEPDAGALGCVDVEVFADIRRAVGAHAAVTAAIGDTIHDDDVERTARAFAAAGAWLVKVGMAVPHCPGRLQTVVAAAIQGARARAATAGVVAVAYADTPDAQRMVLPSIIDCAAAAGAAGVMVDTSNKEGPGLRQLITKRALATWIRRGHEAKLLVAAAGRLTGDDLGWVRDAGADIAGIRGAACASGRSGIMSARLVAELKRTVGLQRAWPEDGKC